MIWLAQLFGGGDRCVPQGKNLMHTLEDFYKEGKVKRTDYESIKQGLLEGNLKSVHERLTALLPQMPFLEAMDLKVQQLLVEKEQRGGDEDDENEDEDEDEDGKEDVDEDGGEDDDEDDEDDNGFLDDGAAGDAVASTVQQGGRLTHVYAQQRGHDSWYY